MSRRRRGLALLLVTGILGILAMLSTAFVTLVRLERRASLQRLHGTKAWLLARAGLEDAAARLAAGQDPEAGASRYLGEDWDASGTLDAFEAAQEAFRVTGAGTPPDVWTCPARHAMRPSFSTLDALGRPRLSPADGRARGYTGSLGPGGGYALGISEPGIDVNGGDLRTAGPHLGTYDTILQRILSNLADEIDAAPPPLGDGVPGNGVPVGRPDGLKLIQLRPTGGWTSASQIRAVAFAGSSAKWAALGPFLALRAWRDRHVIRPNAAGLAGTRPKAWAEIRRGASDDPGFAGGRNPVVPGFERDLAGTIVGRAPVSLAWARGKRPVVAALLNGLSGVWLNEGGGGTYHTWPENDTLTSDLNTVGRMETVTLTSGEARAVADRLAGWTSDLSSWPAFDAFCDSLDAPDLLGAPEQVQAKRDLLKANFNPNSDLNLFNPDAGMWRAVDKSSLLAYSAEFSLAPVHGYELSCAGRVADGEGRVLAERTLAASLGGPGVLRLGTQRDFVCGDLGDPALPMDETDVRRPGAPGFLTESRGAVRTWGHRLDTSGIHPGTWMNGNSRGLGLQSRPEPYYLDEAAGELRMQAAGYDGCLMLATVETVTDDTYGVPAPGADMKMLASYTAGLDLDVSDARAGGNPVGHRCQADSWQTSTTELGNGLLHPFRPGSLLPDGCYVERHRAPAYFDRNNAHGFHGAMSVWVKPNYDIARTLPTGVPHRGHPLLQWTNGGTAWSSDTFGVTDMTPQFFMAGILPSPTGAKFFLHFEIGYDVSDFQFEHQYKAPALLQSMDLRPREWRLATFYWDFQGADGSRCGSVRVDDGNVPAEVDTGNLYAGGFANAPTAATDITIDGLAWPGEASIVPHTLILGKRRRGVYPAVDGYWNVSEQESGRSLGTGADATLDEFVLYDLGQNQAAVQDLAAARYAEGRYYPESEYVSLGDPLNRAGSWISAPLTLPVGAVPVRVEWTWWRPASLPSDYAEIALTDPSGTAYLWGEAASRSTLAEGWNPDACVWRLPGIPAPGPFRIQAVFRRGGAAPQPLLESPVLDDLTVYYTPPGGIPWLGWTEGG